MVDFSWFLALSCKTKQLQKRLYKRISGIVFFPYHLHSYTTLWGGGQIYLLCHYFFPEYTNILHMLITHQQLQPVQQNFLPISSR